MIRRALEGDASAIAALSIEVWLSTYIKHGITRGFADYVLAEYTVSRIEDAINRASERFWVAEPSEGITGYIRTSDHCVAPVAGGGSVEIMTLYVQSCHHRGGVGAALLAEAVREHGEEVWLKMNAENVQAKGFYASQGFARVGTTDFKIGDAAYANDVMALSSIR